MFPLSSSDHREIAMAELTDEQKAAADIEFAKLEPEAELAKYQYMSARVPAEYQDYLVEKYPPPEVTPQGARSAPPSVSEMGQLAALRFTAEGAATKFDEVRSEFESTSDMVQPQPAPDATQPQPAPAPV
jgi:hypothetical protein